MTRIKDFQVINFGSLAIEAGEHFSKISIFNDKFMKLGESSVTCIYTNDGVYLVDTGFINEGDFSEDNLLYNKKILKNKLEIFNLKFEDIEGIFITHWHHDHFGNMVLFPRAKIYYYDPNNEVDLSRIKYIYRDHLLPEFIPLGDHDRFAGGKIFPTIGHTSHHCSLMMDYQEYKICIAGDAIVSQSYYERGEVWPYNEGNLGVGKCKEAMEDIMNIADFIIPGHGHPFENYKKKSQIS